MAMIDAYLEQIRTAVYGREVRSAIANGIELCYQDAQISGDAVTKDMLSSYVTEEDLIGTYLSKTEASTTYAETTDLDLYLSKEAAESEYAKKSDFDDYLKTDAADKKYVTSAALADYLKSSDAADAYATKSSLEAYASKDDISSFITKTVAANEYMRKEDAENYVTTADIASFVTQTYLETEYASKADLSSNHSFEYVICEDTSSTLPQDVESSSGTIGIMLPSEATLWKIYLVPVDGDDLDAYDEYITLKTGETSYQWEKIGGRSSNNVDIPSIDIDLSDYVTYTELQTSYVTKTALEKYMTVSDANLLYVTLETYNRDISELAGSDGVATKTDLVNYLRKNDAEDLYATRTEVDKCLKASDARELYVTKEYVDTQILTAPTGDNILLMLEIETIPGAVQTIYYNDNETISRIIHVRDNTNYRVDSFEFGQHEIVETRVLTTGHTLKITINTDTLETMSEYTAP